MLGAGHQGGGGRVLACPPVHPDQPRPAEVLSSSSDGCNHVLVSSSHSISCVSIITHNPLYPITRYQAKLDIGTPLATKDLTSLVMTLASINYPPEKHSKLLHQVVQEISQKKNSLSELVWLDTVWSLTILGLVNNDLLESVLNINFQHVLQQNNNTNLGATLKLLNINGERFNKSSGYARFDCRCR